MALFQKAKRVSKDIIKRVRISIDDEDEASALNKYEKLNKQIQDLTKEKNILYDTVQQIGLRCFIELYTKNKKYPGTIELAYKDEANQKKNIMFIPMDKYKKIIDPDTFDGTVLEQYIAKKVEYKFNPELIAQHCDTISDLILSCETIPEEDKEALLFATDYIFVKPGTISSLTQDHITKTTLQSIGAIFMVK